MVSPYDSLNGALCMGACRDRHDSHALRDSPTMHNTTLLVTSTRKYITASAKQI